jgi:cytochrome c oxidase assembly protein subunit 15
MKRRTGGLFDRIKALPLLFVVIQVVLGIAAVITSPRKVAQQWGVFEWNAQLHQFVALLLLLSLVSIIFLLNRQGKTNSVPAHRTTAD